MSNKKRSSIYRYDNLPEDNEGRKYILRTRCCLDVAYTTNVICGTCEKNNCELIKFVSTGIFNKDGSTKKKV